MGSEQEKPVTPANSENKSPTPDPTPDTTPANSGNGDGGSAEKLFTQDDLDKTIQKRLERERKNSVSVTELGFESPEKLAAALKELETIRESQLSEAEKQAKQLEKTNGKLTESQARIAQLEAELRDERLSGKVAKAAATCQYPDLPFKWLKEPAQAEILAGIMDETGSVDETALTKALEQHKAAYPAMWKADPHNPGSPPTSPGAKNPTGTDDKFDKFMKDTPPVRL